MTQHIHEGSKVKVRARICDGKASTTNVTFVFMKDKTEFERKPAQLPSVEALGDQGWVEAEVTAPDVDPAKKNYPLTYRVEIAERKIIDLPDFIVWPAKGKIVVKPKVPAEHKDMKGFRFKVMQNTAQTGPNKKVTADDESCEFDLLVGHAFTIEALPPYEIPEAADWVKKDGHEVECKAIMKFEADFLAPQKGDRKQYVNLAPPDAAAADLGRDQKGTAVIVKLGVKGDADRPDGEKFGKAGLIVHFRVSFGPKVGNGGIEKSTRNDPNFKTEMKKELQVKEITGPDADNVYKGKIELKADGTGASAEIKVYLGLAGGDTCKIEIAGSDKFLNDATVAADAVLTFTNWRKSFYELLAADFYDTRELANVAVSGVNHRDFPAAGLTKLKALGDAMFIEYAWATTHTFTPANAPVGAVLTKRFLEIDGTNDNGYILTDYTMGVLPTGVAWQRTNAGLTNYIKLCDANYYFERTAGSFPYNLTRFQIETATVSKDLTVNATTSGWYIPTSGNGTARGGNGSPSVYAPDATNGIAWEAKIDPNAYKTVIDAIRDVRPAGADGAATRTVSITESNQNPAACDVIFTKPAIGNISTTVSPADKTRIEAWVQALFTPASLKAHNNKITITVSGESGNDRRNTRFTAVKTIVQNKLTALNGSRIAVHPGLDDTGVARKGKLPLTAIDMTVSTRKVATVKLPAVNATDPGSFVGAASATKCPIKLDCYIEAHSEALGLADGADVLCVFHQAQAAIDVCVTMHELGHTYGQSVFTGHLPPKGMAQPKTVTQAETVVRYKIVGNNGHHYDRHPPHSGDHCAYGLSDVEKSQADYQPAGMSAQCVMFGAGGVNRTFCPQCVDLIRGANLTAIPAPRGT